MAADEANSRPIINGVYFLFQDHALVYVGKSRDCYARIAAHRSNGRVFDYARALPVSEDDTGWIEAAFIRSMDPSQNKHHRRQNAQPDAAPKVAESTHQTHHVSITRVSQGPQFSDMNEIIHMAKARDILKGHDPLGFVAACDAGTVPAVISIRNGAKGIATMRRVRVGDVLQWKQRKSREMFGSDVSHPAGPAS